MHRQFLAIALLCAVCALPAAEDGQQPKPEKGDKAAKTPSLTLDELPPAVKSAAEGQASGAVIDRIRADERGGEKLYNVRFTRDGVKTEVRLNSEGKVLRMRAERSAKDSSLPTTSLPAAVQTTVSTKLNGGQISRIEQTQEKDATVYIISIEGASGRQQLTIDANGTVLDERQRKPDEGRPKKDDGEAKPKPQDPVIAP